MTENNINNQYTDDQEIDIMELISKLWKKRTMIIKWCVVGAVIGLIVGFSIPKTYTSSVTLAPETQQKTNSSVSSIASMMGVNINNSVDAISIDMYPDVVHSTPFIVELLDLPVTFEWKDEQVTTDPLTYMLEYQKSPWWSYVIGAPFKIIGLVKSLGKEEDKRAIDIESLDLVNLPKKVRKVVKFFSENIILNVDKKTGKTSISLEMQDPLVVATVVDAVMESLKTYMSDYRTSKARQDVDNLQVICDQRKTDYYITQQAYANYVDANKNVVRQSAQAELERLQQEMNLAYQVYSQVATQLEGARIQVQQDKPVFVIIDPVMIPLQKSAPSKSKLLIVFTFLAGCFASFWILFLDNVWIKIRQIL